ncbi:Monocyte to macrophage differentiation factor [Frankliniella fusca]|uniref:Monocyte to macrophage differentiation factor n=1 Tax=Frankliniella fusca TaxID=407009 RepID=A0AAE1GU36_9NEOP|nr:Monocyte to macrophage differentiation factor [Frankliniella fusca]
MTKMTNSYLSTKPLQNCEDSCQLSTSTMDWFLKRMRCVKWRNSPALCNQAYVPTTAEHIANIITHGILIIPSALASCDLMERSRTGAQYMSALVYGSSLVLLFFMSTSFHTVHFCGLSRTLKDLLHRTDRAMIYVFIAASYFPWLMLGPVGADGLGSQLWWLIWVLAFCGILYQQLFHEKYKTLETIFYCFMAIVPALTIMPEDDFHGLTELKFGGLIYLIGVSFFKCDGRIPCAHAIWHLMVALAAATHYNAIQKYLYP